jgi:hypothetical protein
MISVKNINVYKVIHLYTKENIWHKNKWLKKRKKRNIIIDNVIHEMTFGGSKKSNG